MVERYLSILFCTSSNFYLGEPCSLFLYGVKAPANWTVRRVTSDRIQDVIFFSVAARLIPLSGQCANSFPLQASLSSARKAPSYAAHQAFTDNYPENHANGLCDVPQIRTIFDFEVEITIGLIWPKKGAMMGYLIVMHTVYSMLQ